MDNLCSIPFCFSENNRIGLCPSTNVFSFFNGILCCSTEVAYADLVGACPSNETIICPYLSEAVCRESSKHSFMIDTKNLAYIQSAFLLNGFGLLTFQCHLWLWFKITVEKMVQIMMYNYLQICNTQFIYYIWKKIYWTLVSTTT